MVECAILAHDQNDFMAPRKTDKDLLNPWIKGPAFTVEAFQEGDFILLGQRV